MMQYTQLGERGPRVSRIAFGNWSAGGDWGGVDRAAAVAAMREALDLGITLFDTARAYGFGAAGELLGEALRPEIRSARDSIVIATKGGLRKENGLPVRDSSPGALRRDLEASLRSLGTDHVDLYEVHWPDPATPIADTAETLDRVRLADRSTGRDAAGHRPRYGPGPSPAGRADGTRRSRRDRTGRARIDGWTDRCRRRFVPASRSASGAIRRTHAGQRRGWAVTRSRPSCGWAEAMRLSLSARR